MKKVTYKDIAAIAKVSVSTVSRYFNNGYISLNRQERISRALDNADYTKRILLNNNFTARSHVYFIVQSWKDTDLMEIMNSIDETTRIQQADLLITAAAHDVENYVDSIKKIISRNPNAVVLINPPKGKQVLDFLKGLKTETMILSYGTHIPGINSIYINYQSLITTLAHEFVRQTGDPKIALITDYKLNQHTLKSQMHGFTEFCKDNRVLCIAKYFDNRDAESVIRVINELKNRNFKNIICSTHDVFQNMVINNSLNEFNLSDIGYNTIFDYNHKYFLKQFIDYNAIWLQMEDIIVKGYRDKVVEINSILINSRENQDQKNND